MEADADHAFRDVQDLNGCSVHQESWTDLLGQYLTDTSFQITRIAGQRQDTPRVSHGAGYPAHLFHVQTQLFHELIHAGERLCVTQPFKEIDH